MARVKFSRDFTVPIDGSRTKTYPQGWEGQIEDNGVAWQAVDGKHGEFIGDPPPRPAVDPKDVKIPDGWKDLRAAELVELARKLGADADVKTRDAAGDFIAAVEAGRAKLV